MLVTQCKRGYNQVINTASKTMKRLAESDIDEAFQMLLKGASLRSAAKQLKIAPSTLSERLSRKYGKGYAARVKPVPSPTLLLLEEYSNSKDPRLAAAAKKFAILHRDSIQNFPVETRGFFTLKQELQKSWVENLINLDYSFLDSRKGRGVCKLC